MRLAVVTPTFNGAPFLRGTAHSILSQSGDFDLRWYVIDGGSTDGTPDIVRGLNDARVTLVCEPDRGQSHAVNKGFALAGEGGAEVVSWIGADDLYAPGALAAVARSFNTNPHAQWLVGRYEVIDAQDRPVRQGVVRYKRRRLERYSYRALLRENFIPQPAVFWRAEFGRRVGPLDESLYWTMDYDLWLRMGRLCAPLVVDDLLARFRLHPTSKTGRADRRQFDEQYRVAKRYFGNDWRSRVVHRLNVEKVVWAYRVLGWLGK